MANMIHDIQSVLTKMKDDSSHAEERLSALEEEIRLLWAASRKNNFDIHNLESKAQDAEDRLKEVTSQVEKMSDFVTEQWIQIQHLEQAVYMEEFVKDLSETKLSGMLEPYFLGKGSALSSYLSQAQQQLNRFFLAFKKFHCELQGFIKQEMVKKELTAALANVELIFFVVSALITFPILASWVLFLSQFS